jgi:solute carrier family 25 S-adenosylmethionine transporter 26
MIAAVIGESCANLVRNPFELVKQNMQIGNFSNMRQAFNTIIKTEGVLGLYRGYLITIVREIPFGIIQFPLYEILKQKMIENGKNDTFYFGLSGSIAGCISAFLTNPIDVIKTRIMTAENDSLKLNLRKRIKSTITTIIADESYLTFFKGVHIRMIYISIGGFMFFGTNEYIKKQLNYYKHI